MIALFAILALLMAFWVYRIATTLRAVNARQRAILAGSTTPPLFPKFAPPSLRKSLSPVGAGQGGATLQAARS